MREATLTALFSALADPTRRAILATLAERERPVHELAQRFAISRPAVSKHLAVLRKAGLVNEARSGRENLYTLEAERLKAVRDWLERFWRTRLGALKKLAEEDT